VQVFPLGNFRFEKTSLEAIIDLLHLTEKARQEALHSIARNTMPVLNIYHDPIPVEGPAGAFRPNILPVGYYCTKYALDCEKMAP